MVPPPRDALNPKVTPVVDMLVMSAVGVVELSDSTQTGALEKALANVRVQDVTLPPPTVIVPAMSVPITEGLPVPQDETEGAVPDETTCPSYCTPKTGVAF